MIEMPYIAMAIVVVVVVVVGDLQFSFLSKDPFDYFLLKSFKLL